MGGDGRYNAIGDSGAGAVIGSIEALQAQGANPDQLKKIKEDSEGAPNSFTF
jgi:hypothetical protein